MKKIIILPFILIFISCAYNSKVPNRNEEFKNFNSQITKKLEDLLPLKDVKTIQNCKFVHSVYPNSINYFGYSAYFVGFNYSAQEFNSEYNYIKSKCKNLSNRDQVSYISPTKKVFNNNVVPDIKEEFNNPKHYIDDNATTYLFKKEEGMFLRGSSNYYSKTKDIIHGYQSGAFVDENSRKVMYWVVFW